MKMSELKGLTLVELQAKGRGLRQELFNLRLHHHQKDDSLHHHQMKLK